ncbi:hypothetical protein J1614_004262 [Plenodomus biglobosus]|nr:hypothetical protein J1614_004262 [Plenodomus biglobosus]
MDEATPRIKPAQRHLGHAILDALVRPVLHTSPRQIFQNGVRLFASLSLSHRIIVITLAILFAVAEYEEPGFLPFRGLVVFITTYSLAVLLVFALVALKDWLETAVWPWDDPGWVWPWERWFWASNLTDSEASMSTVQEWNQAPGDQCADKLMEDLSELVPTEAEAGLRRRVHSQDEEPFAALPCVGTREGVSSPAIAPLDGNEEEMAISSASMLSQGMRSESMPPPTPVEGYHSASLRVCRVVSVDHGNSTNTSVKALRNASQYQA